MLIVYICLVSLLFQTSSAPILKRFKAVFSRGGQSSRGGRGNEIVPLPQSIQLKRALLLTDACAIEINDLKKEQVKPLLRMLNLDMHEGSSFSARKYLNGEELKEEKVNVVDCFDILPKLNEFLEIRLFTLPIASNFNQETDDSVKLQIVWGYIDQLDQTSQLFLFTDIGVIKTFYNKFIELNIENPLKNLKAGVLGSLLYAFSTTDKSREETDIYTLPGDMNQLTIYPRADEERSGSHHSLKLKHDKNVQEMILWIIANIDFENRLSELRSILLPQGEAAEMETQGEAQELAQQSTEGSSLLGMAEV